MTNYYIYFLVALIPLAVGAVYYHPKVAGSAWMKTNGFTPESLQGANMALIFGLCYVFSLLMSVILTGIVIHQSSFQSLAFGLEPASEAFKEIMNVAETYSDRHRSFGHGALHGSFLTLFFVFPLIAINALFERRGWTYILIHTGYWFISLVLMGGLICLVL